MEIIFDKNVRFNNYCKACNCRVWDNISIIKCCGVYTVLHTKKFYLLDYDDIEFDSEIIHKTTNEGIALIYAKGEVDKLHKYYQELEENM